MEMHPLLKSDLKRLFWIAIIVRPIIGYCYYIYYENNTKPIPFDQKVWQYASDDSADKEVRQRMINDVLENHLHLDMMKDDVINVLGRDETPWKQNPKDNQIAYNLGIKRIFSNELLYLKIHFHSNDKVSKFETINYQPLWSVD